jgi:hypothetical protein
MPRLLLAGQKIGGYRGQKPVGAYDRFHTTIQRPAGEGERNNRCARQIWGDGLRVAFKERRAAPILIWRYLTETAGVDPAKVAVYCDLKFDKKFPRPAEFTLFSGGEDDYAVFKERNYRHIIFNLSLQEGWDDPECCFAYIDRAWDRTCRSSR